LRGRSQVDTDLWHGLFDTSAGPLAEALACRKNGRNRTVLLASFDGLPSLSLQLLRLWMLRTHKGETTSTLQAHRDEHRDGPRHRVAWEKSSAWKSPRPSCVGPRPCAGSTRGPSMRDPG